MESFAAVYLPAFATWAAICGTYAVARRSWVELTLLGFLVNLPVVALWLFARRAGVAAGFAINGAFLAWFAVSLVRNVWLTRARR